MTEMIEKSVQEAKIRSGSPRRDPVCYETQRDIVIPAGTILRDQGVKGYVAADVGFGPNFSGTLEVQLHVDATASGFFERVIA